MSGEGRDKGPDGEIRDGSAISRRRALTILGAVPVAAALGQQPKPLTASGTSSAPKKLGLATPHAAFGAPQFFNKHEWQTVRVLVDYIIPRDDVSGSATEAKVPEYMDFLLAEKDASLNTQTEIRGGLAWLDTECRRRFDKTFVASTDTQRKQVLDDIAFPTKAKREFSNGVAFFNRFRDMTASGFYSSAMGWQDVRYMGNVFNPGYDGCPPAALEKLGVSYDLMKTFVSPQEK